MCEKTNHIQWLRLRPDASSWRTRSMTEACASTKRCSANSRVPLMTKATADPQNLTWRVASLPLPTWSEKTLGEHGKNFETSKTSQCGIKKRRHQNWVNESKWPRRVKLALILV